MVAEKTANKFILPRLVQAIS